MLNIIDSHLHVWMLERGDYAWLTPDTGVLYRNFSIDQARKVMAEHLVSRCILVQATNTVAETEYLLDIADSHSQFVAGVVGWVDFESADVVDDIKRLSKHAALVGLRPMLQDIDATDWILNPDFHRVFACMQQQELVFDALIYPRHLEVIDELASCYPGLSIVVDHCGKPDLDAETLTCWQQGLARLARHPEVTVKLSGLASQSQYAFELDKITPIVEFVCRHFGPKRILWGSDWPVVNQRCDYRQWLDASLNIISQLGFSSEQAEQIFVHNAERIYLSRSVPGGQID
ncbi:amidohydrolase family protein [Neptunicella sp. SCSIO 80796]|uniref:amidohydrolase family protein n=1 Tax=Neptunicella plasticusilytica TaxID=3117012 RepID=UPI003A4E3E14